MSEGVIVALISAGGSLIVGFLAFLGVVLTNKKASEKMIQRMEVQQAVTDTKIEELTREVREHNNFARRMPVAESEIKHLHDDIEHLKKYHEGG